MQLQFWQTKPKTHEQHSKLLAAPFHVSQEVITKNKLMTTLKKYFTHLTGHFFIKARLFRDGAAVRLKQK